MNGKQSTGISRRESLRRAGLLSLGAGVPFSFAACSEQAPAAWVMATPDPIDAPGYGTDPNLIHPEPAPWPKTLTDPQLETLSALADLLIPKEGDLPSATEVGVVDVLDEWVSAPYPDQQRHRAVLLSGLDWCDRESQRRCARPFAEAGSRDQIAIIDHLSDPAALPELAGPQQFFQGLRQLVVGAYYTSPEGVRELGYQGNVAISGDYPGPSEAAMTHLIEQIDKLGLELPVHLAPARQEPARSR